MTDLEVFQASHGRDWAEIVRTQAFPAALSIATSEKIQTILLLSDEEIATKAHIFLADLRGHLRYEAALLGLHEKKETVFSDGPMEDYSTDPEREANEMAQDREEPEDDQMPLVPSKIEVSVRKRKPKKRAKK